MGVSIKQEPNLPNPNRLEAEVTQAMQETTEFTKDLIVDHVETSGTDREWKGSWYGRTHSGRGRVNTGEMRDAVSSDVEATDRVVTGRAGWIRNVPDYLNLQEDGFTHYISGEQIEGMKALDSVMPDARDEFVRQAAAAIRRATK